MKPEASKLYSYFSSEITLKRSRRVIEKSGKRNNSDSESFMSHILNMGQSDKLNIRYFLSNQTSKQHGSRRDKKKYASFVEAKEKKADCQEIVQYCFEVEDLEYHTTSSALILKKLFEGSDFDFKGQIRIHNSKIYIISL